MPKYELVLSPAAKRDLKRLPLNIQKDIARVHLLKIAENPYGAGKPLVGALRRERSYHFDRKPEYRITYRVEENLITITLIGTREGLYKKAARRR